MWNKGIYGPSVRFRDPWLFYVTLQRLLKKKSWLTSFWFGSKSNLARLQSHWQWLTWLFWHFSRRLSRNVRARESQVISLSYYNMDQILKTKISLTLKLVWVFTNLSCLTHSHIMTLFDAYGKEAFRKHCGKRRNCSLRAISPFPTMFSTLSKTEIIIFVTFNFSSANAFTLVWSKILSSVNGLNKKKYSVRLHTCNFQRHSEATTVFIS